MVFHPGADNAANQETLKTALGTLIRVLDAVDWDKISKGNPDAWLYFYEDFLEVYDNDLRKLTGSYYTAPEVVGAMVGLVSEALKSARYGLHAGLASLGRQTARLRVQQLWSSLPFPSVRFTAPPISRTQWWQSDRSQT